MVSYSRAATRSGSLRPLGQPAEVGVEVGRGGFPVALTVKRAQQVVCHVEDAWRLDDEWWRSCVTRRYFRVLLDGGRRLVVYHDLAADRWYAQP